MSFSSKVKGELSLHLGNGRHCEIAETAAIVNIWTYSGFWGTFLFKNTDREFPCREKVLYIIEKYF